LPGTTPVSICVFRDLRHSRYFSSPSSGKRFDVQNGGS
jgi:hypothetical protein